MDARPYISSTANDLDRFRAAHIHLADTQFVGIRMLVLLLHEPDHHPLSQGGKVIDLLFLEAGH